MKKGSSHSLPENQEFLEALREFKENMERRMSNLEEIVSDGRSSNATPEPDREKKKPQRSIELELEGESRSAKKSEQSNSKLRNMLNQ